MKNYEVVVAEAVRIEYTENDDKLFIVFEVKDPHYKQHIKKSWATDIEFRLVDKLLVKEE